MPEQTEAEAVAELAANAYEAERLAPGEVYLVAGGDGRQTLIDTDGFAESPRRATADRVIIDAPSFSAYLVRHGSDGSELYADPQRAEVIAILDSHSGYAPGWQQHRATLKLTTSPAWDAWRRHDGELMTQARFAEHIELQASDVREPLPADLLDLAQTFEATKSVDYESSERIDTGQVRFRYVETVEARAGQKGELSIPTQIRLALRPYLGGPAYAVTARFRYRIGADRHLQLGYVLERPQLILDQAFEEVVELLRTGRPEKRNGDDELVEREVLAVQAPIFLGRA